MFSYPDISASVAYEGIISVSGVHEGVLYSVLLPRYISVSGTHEGVIFVSGVYEGVLYSCPDNFVSGAHEGVISVSGAMKMLSQCLEFMKVYFTLLSYPDISVFGAHEGVLYSVILPRYLRLRSP
jgi:hypothetical protein